MSVKMIVLDLDGTLLRTDKSVSTYSASVLEKCREKGIYIALATARAEKAAERIVRAVQPQVVISNGGAKVSVNGQTILRRALLVEDTEAIIADVVSSGEWRSITVECDSGYYVSYDSYGDPDYAHGIHRDFTRPFREAAYKLTVELASSDAAARIAGKHPTCGMLRFTGEDWYRFAHRDANKLNAVKKAAEYLGIDMKDVAAFGDDYNDIDMLEGCGTGVAMGNAIEEVKRAAGFVCGTNDEDGAAEWIEEHIL